MTETSVVETKEVKMANKDVVHGRIQVLLKEGKTYTEVAEILAAEGVQTPQGKHPTSTFVANVLSYHKRKESGASKVVSAKPVATPKKVETPKVVETKTRKAPAKMARTKKATKVQTAKTSKVVETAVVTSAPTAADLDLIRQVLQTTYPDSKKLALIQSVLN